MGFFIFLYGLSLYLSVIFLVANIDRLVDTRGGALLAFLCAFIPVLNTLLLLGFGYFVCMRDGFVAWLKAPL